MADKPMKRSRKASLVLMGTVPFLLAACENSERALVYRTVSECQRDQVLTSEECETRFTRAGYESERVAPRYRNQQDCEADFGPQQCQSSSGYFIPLMRGVLVKDPRPALNEDEQGSAGAGAGGGGGGGSYYSSVAQPLYESRDDKGMLRTPDNDKVSRLSGPVEVKESYLQAKPTARVVSRGGFGRAAAARAGG